MSTLMAGVVDWIEQLDPVMGAAVLVLATAACVVSAVLPTTPLNFAASFVTGGVLSGSLAVAVGCTLGSAINFALGRSCLRTWAQRQLRASPKLLAFEAALADRAARMVALVRLSPVFPFALIGYVLGATDVDFVTFTWATFVGVWPSCALYCWISQSMGDTVAAAQGGGRAAGNQTGSAVAAGGGGESLSSVVGIVGGVLATVLVSWQAKRIFDDAIRAGGYEKAPAQDPAGPPGAKRPAVGKPALD